MSSRRDTRSNCCCDCCDKRRTATLPLRAVVAGLRSTVLLRVNFSASSLMAIIHSRISRSVLAPNINGLLLALQASVAYFSRSLRLFITVLSNPRPVGRIPCGPPRPTKIRYFTQFSQCKPWLKLKLDTFLA